MKIPEQFLWVLFGVLFGVLVLLTGEYMGYKIGKSVSRYDEGVAVGKVQQYDQLLGVAKGIKR